MAVSDPVHDLVHDHAELNRQVRAIGVQLRALGDRGVQSGRETEREIDALVDGLGRLRDQLFLHFAREEEGLFPFVIETLPELSEPVHAMETAHDTICGALARMVHLASVGTAASSMIPLYDRFEHAYGTHARTESELLETLESRLDGEHRKQLAAVVAGL